jgi:phosphoribosylamine--glycine ligase / phosphoribosylformylglycinamidine cyclo-ligase
MTERLRILVIGSGGREHALAWSLSQCRSVDVVHVCPGNGGTALTTTDDNSPILNFDISTDDFTGLVAHAKKHGINLVVPGPEAPLVAGICGYFQAVGIRCFGPTKAAARMEGSKAHAKDFMQRHAIPTASFRSFSNYEDARRYLDGVGHEVVIKADGLAAGKGVVIPESVEEAQKALREIMLDRQFGTAGDEVIIEQFLEGEELSVLTFSDGYTIRSLPPAQDHKRIFDGDTGPNTGGMGCYAPTKMASMELIAEIDRLILQPTIDSMRREGTPFVGVLFTGLMITPSGPKVIEYNVRFGDPEIQTLLPLLSKDTDLARVMVACTEHWLDGVDLKADPKFSATVVASAEGYPGSYAKHRPMKFDPVPKDTYIFHAGTALDGNNKKLVTTGGRVIAATATASSLEEAVSRAYQGIKTIHFEGMHYRTDIAHRALSNNTITSPSSTEPLNPSSSDEITSTTPLTYASAGVSIPDGNTLVSLIKPLVLSTSRPGSPHTSIGGFGGLFDLSCANLGLPASAPTLIGAIDGVGTKLKIAYTMGKHDTVGIDLVAMNVNDLIVQGAEPVMFLDAFTCSKLDVGVATKFVEGVARGCREAGCALVGGETAEMPGMLRGGEYDAIGAAVGVVDTRGGEQEKEGSSGGGGKKILPDIGSMGEGDVLLGLASSGCHSNGYSLIRKIIERKRLGYFDPAPWDPRTSVGLSLLTPTRIYAKSLLRVVKRDLVRGMAHITGGGLRENVPRMLPKHLAAEIDVGAFERPAVFDWLQDAGRVSSDEMSTAFNNGLGMVLVVSSAASGEVMRELEAEGEKVWRVGKLVKRKKETTDPGCILLNLEEWDKKRARG